MLFASLIVMLFAFAHSDEMLRIVMIAFGKFKVERQAYTALLCVLAFYVLTNIKRCDILFLKIPFSRAILPSNGSRSKPFIRLAVSFSFCCRILLLITGRRGRRPLRLVAFLLYICKTNLSFYHICVANGNYWKKNGGSKVSPYSV